MNSKKFFDWCRTAVSSIKRWPQKDEIQKDLYSRLEDRYASFREGGYSHEESEKKTLAAMGDPQEVAARLAKTYKPFWPKLLVATRCCVVASLVFAIAVVLLFVPVDDIMPLTHIDLITEGKASYILHPNVSQYSDGYTMTVNRIAYEPYIEHPDKWYTIDKVDNLLLLDMVVTHPQIWICPPTALDFLAIDNKGNVYKVGIKNERYAGENAAHTGLFQYTHQLSISNIDAKKLEWIELRCNNEGRNLVWRIDLPGGGSQ